MLNRNNHLPPPKKKEGGEYVIHGKKWEKVGISDVTLHKYFAALCQMGKDVTAPYSWKEPMAEYFHQIAIMVAPWEWGTFFTMIDNGRLPHSHKGIHAQSVSG